jgi:hypothetical protein
MQDVGELAYGGLVVAGEWYDDKRIDEGKITKKDILKKASFYAYLIPGSIATLTSAFGWWKAVKPWDEHISHGFIYDFPRFVKNMVDAMGEPTNRGAGDSAAVIEAQRILTAKKQAASRQLGAGRGTDRSYQQEFESVAPFAI